MTTVERAKAPLSPKQMLIYEFIVQHWGETMAVPTIREIGSAFKIRSPNGVVCHLRAMHAKGWIAWHSTKGRKAKGDRARARGIVVPELQRVASVAAKLLLIQGFLKEPK